MTLVAFTTHTASSPTRSPSSSTASAVIRLTSRCGPAITSTTAATRSFSIRVTIPGNRLRADPATIGRSAAASDARPSSRVTSSIGDHALAARRTRHPQPALGLPAAQRLDGHLEHLGRLADPKGAVGGCAVRS